MPFNKTVLDMPPYVAHGIFTTEEGHFGKRLIAGAFVFSAGTTKVGKRQSFAKQLSRPLRLFAGWRLCVKS